MKFSKQIILRYLISTFIGVLFIFIMKINWKLSFDSVASTSLFSCIIAVAGEDNSLGPVIQKSIYRSIGTLFGGLIGYSLLYLQHSYFSNYKYECLLIIPTLFVTIIQFSTQGGVEFTTKLKNKYKAGHLIIQMQVAFGIIYVGSWDDNQSGFNVALARTVAVLVGGVILLFSSFLAYPETSLKASSDSLSICIRTTGSLLVNLANDKIEDKELKRFDHRGKIFSSKSQDNHITMLELIDTKLNRVNSLQSFLYFDPAWVPGLPFHLIGTQMELGSHWKPFFGVLASRITRYKSTLSAMDSNMRICSSYHPIHPNKFFQNDISISMKQLVAHVNKSMENIACFIESPFNSNKDNKDTDNLKIAGWKGKIALKQDLIENYNDLKKYIDDFALIFSSFVRISYSNTELPQSNNNNNNNNNITDTNIKYKEVDLNRNNNIQTEGNNSNITKTKIKSRKYEDVVLLNHRDQLGEDTLAAYHKIHPMRTFCNLTIQCCIQTTSLISEVIDFIECIENENIINETEELEFHFDNELKMNDLGDINLT